MLLLQVSASAEVLPPWKQGDYVAEASYTSVTGMRSVTSVSSATQLHIEKSWEQQVAATREVIMPHPHGGAACRVNARRSSLGRV